jgi:replicative DNA helicase
MQPKAAGGLIRVTVFQSIKQTQGETQDLPWADFADRLHKAKPKAKEAAQLIKLGTYYDNSRATAAKGGRGFEAAWGVEGDYDAGEIAPETAVARLTAANVRAVVATTYNHRAERPRWRVFAPLSAPVPANNRAPLLARLDAVLGFCLARESYDPERAYFVGAVPAGGEQLVWTVDGEKTVDQLPPAELPTPQKKPQEAPKPAKTADTRWDALDKGEDVHANTLAAVASMVRAGVPDAMVHAFGEAVLVPRIAQTRGGERAEQLKADLPRIISGASKYRPETDRKQLTAPPLVDLRAGDPARGLLARVTTDPGAIPFPAEWRKIAAVSGSAKLSAGLHVVAGQTGSGKSQFAVALARGAALAGHPVVYLSLELSRAEVAARLVSLETSYLTDETGDGAKRLPAVWWSTLARGAKIGPNLEEAVQNAVSRLQDPLERFYIWAPDPTAPATVTALGELVRDVAREHPGKAPLVVVDYLQAPGFQLDQTPAAARLPIRERIGAISMGLRHISKETDDGWPGCPVLVLSTTGRGNVAGRDAVKGLDGGDPDLIRTASVEQLKAMPKEAGEIEAASVSVWILASRPPNARETDAGENDPQGRGAETDMAIRLAKARLAPAGPWVPLRMRGATGRITEDLDRYKKAAAADAKAAKDREERRKKAAERRAEKAAERE